MFDMKRLQIVNRKKLVRITKPKTEFYWILGSAIQEDIKKCYKFIGRKCKNMQNLKKRFESLWLNQKVVAVNRDIIGKLIGIYFKKPFCQQLYDRIVQGNFNFKINLLNCPVNLSIRWSHCYLF